MKLKLEPTLCSLAIALLALIAVGALAVGWIMQIDYSDSYHIFLNARAILGEKATYSFHRGMIAGPLQTPWFLIEKLIGNTEWAFRLSKLASAALFLLTGWVAYDFYRRYSDRLTALLSLLALVSVPIFIHYIPSAKEDLPATFFTLLGFSLYLTHRKPAKFWGLVGAGTCFSLAMGLRYNLIPLFPLCVVGYELVLTRNWKKIWNEENKERYFTLLFLPFILLFLYTMILFPLGRGIPFFASPYQFLAELLVQYEGNKAGYKPSSTVYFYLLKAWSGPGILLALLGLLECLRKKKPEFLLLTIWTFVFLLAQTYLISGKEARYLFPFFPAFAFFVGTGGAVLVRSSSRPFLRWSFGILILVWAGNRAAYEFSKFRDPFYRSRFPLDVPQRAEKLASNAGKIIWVGTYFEQHPQSAVFHPLDDYAYVYHAYQHVLEFYLRRPAQVLVGGQIEMTPRGPRPVGIEGLVEDGDVLVINPDMQARVTRNLPEEAGTLWIQRVKKVKGVIEYGPVETVSRGNELKS